MNRKKILMVNEASHSLTGFGTYGRELLHRLTDMDKYHLAEFASYARIGDPRDAHVRWRYYPNAVDSNDERFKEYDSKMSHQWGEWRFERVLLDFQPDIVFDIRDHWMLAYEANSPYRPYFHWAIMPTVDSAPQQDEWIGTFLNADGVFTYSDWALNILRDQSDGRINLQTCAYPGVNLQTFAPVEDKVAHREKMGFNADSFIIGTVMRNQKRKLYPDLFRAFRMFLNNAKPELARKTYLYVHTSFPDRGWDIPGLLKEFGLGSKVLFTYICKATGRPFCAFFQDAKTYSPYANAPTGVLPGVSTGLTSEDMAEVYNLFDVYIQYAICEGFGMPQVEAAACGVPIMAVDYSAMADVVRKTKGFPLKVQRMFREMETNAYRALPDNEYCAKTIEKFFTMSDEAKAKHYRQARQAVEEIYNWDRTAQVWADYFDAVELTGLQGKWNAPPLLHHVPSQIPEGLNNPQFVKWLFTHVINKPDEQHSLLALNTLKDLNYGLRVGSGKEIIPITRDDVMKSYLNVANNILICEQARTGMMSVDLPDYIQYAEMKERLAEERAKKKK